MAVAATVAAKTAARSRKDSPGRERQNKAPEEVKALKIRDNVTNWAYLARIYLLLAVSIGAAIYLDHLAMSGQIAWWLSIPVTVLAIVAVGASQHQFGGVVHEGTHYMLFANRKLNELASDWLASLPHPHDDIPFPAAPSGAPPVHQRSRARSRHQPVARQRPLARFPHHPR